MSVVDLFQAETRVVEGLGYAKIVCWRVWLLFFQFFFWPLQTICSFFAVVGRPPRALYGKSKSVKP